MKKLVGLIMIALLFQACNYIIVCPVQAQIEGQKNDLKPDDGLDENFRVMPNGNNETSSVPTVPIVPAPLAVALPEPASLGMPPPASLSWRSRALSLANEYPKKKNSIAWALPISYVKDKFY